MILSRACVQATSLLVLWLCFSTSALSASSSARTTSSNSNRFEDKVNNILILDHLNINHEKGRHDWLKAFYVDFLQCALDPRKMKNVQNGKKTIWANIGAQQFHLPEGKPQAQVLDGCATLVYPGLEGLQDRYGAVRSALEGSKFEMKVSGDRLHVMDPWGSSFCLVSGTEADDSDPRGRQRGDASEGLAMRDLTIHIPAHSNVAGIGRFYQRVLGSLVTNQDEVSIQIQVGPKQTLTFRQHSATTVDSHVDLHKEEVDGLPVNAPNYLSNYGPHLLVYVADMPEAYQAAAELGLTYVNPRFKRRAYTLEEAIDDCMFRCLDIVDPDDIDSGPIVQLEHEVRSVVKRDGSKYKSCPFDEIPKDCFRP